MKKLIYTRNMNTSYMSQDAAEQFCDNWNCGEYPGAEDHDTCLSEFLNFNFLLHTSEKWELMKEYQTPEDADYSTAIVDFTAEIYENISVEDLNPELTLTCEMMNEDTMHGMITLDGELISDAFLPYYNEDTSTEVMVELFREYLTDEAGEGTTENVKDELELSYDCTFTEDEVLQLIDEANW